MAKQNQVQNRSYDSGADLSADQYKVMVLSSGKVILQTSSLTHSAGVLQNNPDAADQAAEVAYGGQVKIVAGARLPNGSGC